MKLTCKHSEAAYIVDCDMWGSGEWVWRCCECHLKHVMKSEAKKEYIKEVCRDEYYAF